MDIHKPKPWHGAREFLKEYLIIVIGVLTALGAEQGVEWLHWRHQVEAARVVLRQETHRNAVAAAERLAQVACGNARLIHLRDKLRASSPWKADPLGVLAGQVTPMVYAMHVGKFNSGAFQSALASGVLNHMPPEELARYSEVYALLDGLRTAQSAEIALQTRLAPLAYDADFTSTERNNWQELLGELDGLAGQMMRRADLYIAAAGRVGAPLTAADVAAVAKEPRSKLGGCYFSRPGGSR